MRLFALASMSLVLINPPPVFARIAQCETGSNWSHSTRDYISAYGIYRPAWNEYRPSWVRRVPNRRVRGEVLPSRLEQTAVALSIAREAGLSAWGCHRNNAWVRNG